MAHNILKAHTMMNEGKKYSKDILKYYSFHYSQPEFILNQRIIFRELGNAKFNTLLISFTEML